MNVLCFPIKAAKKLGCLIVLWIIVSTVVPYYARRSSSDLKIDLDGYLHTTSLYNLNAETVMGNGLTDADVVVVTAHPDDESMFFAPTLLELSKLNYNNKIHLLCFSNGNYDGLGEIRARELSRAAAFLGISSVRVLDYTDDIRIGWDSNGDVVDTLSKELAKLETTKSQIVLLTFDEEGVSGHPNHKSLYHGVENYARSSSLGKQVRLFKLKSWPVYVKYSSCALTSFELLVRHLKNQPSVVTMAKKLFEITSSPQHSQKYATNESRITIFSDFNSWFVNLSTMTYAHYSQIVWFRWLWVFFSKYMNSNELELVFSS